MPERLREFHQRYRTDMCTKTRDTSEYGFHYLSGLLRMECERTMANIGRMAQISEQNMQQFISDSPWRGERMISHVQYEIGQRPEYQRGNVLLIDESADAKAGKMSAGAGRQYNGRLGKVDLCQVGVFLGVTNNGYATWIDGELFLPEAWFSEAASGKRHRLGLPTERQFETKLQLALKMVKRLKERETIAFEAIDCDALYGRKGWFRDQLQVLEAEYYADIPENTTLYLERPHVYFPLTKAGHPSKQPEITGMAYSAKALKEHSGTEWQTFTLRPSERGMLTADFARRRIWTADADGTIRQEWLLIRQDADDTTYSLSNAAADTPFFTMAERKSQRFFIERSHQDAKSELGWDEFQAIKYRAWQHRGPSGWAFTILASWFVTETRLEWAQQYPPDPQLLTYYDIDVLPKISVANVRTLLRAAMPLPQLSPAQAIELVAKHLDNRTRSRKSRLKTKPDH
jgi:SRSO17 transposase